VGLIWILVVEEKKRRRKVWVSEKVGQTMAAAPVEIVNAK